MGPLRTSFALLTTTLFAATAAPGSAHVGADGTATPLEVSSTGDLLHVDPKPGGAATDVPRARRTGTVVPVLHSRPGAAKRVYLDFDGFTHVRNARSWASNSTFTISPYTGSAAMIQEVWQAVAEDFAPFDVDITTEEPPAADLSGTGDGRFGVRVVVGGTPQQAGFPSGTAGVAPWFGQVGTFSNDMNPGAFAFANLFGASELDELADTISHETGHVFGLAHDGTGTVCTPCDPDSNYYGGHGTWGPVMGIPVGRTVTTWSAGTYPGANNVEDDLSLISRWMGLVPDDAPDTPDVTGAPSLGGPAASVAQRGLIRSPTDTDVWRFSAAAGAVDLTVAPPTPGPNLDARAELLDATGAVVASADDPDGLGARIATTVAAGTYLLRVDGTGDVDPAPGYDDYASLGTYRIEGSYPDPVGLAPVAVASPGPRVAGPGPLSVAFDSSASTAGQGTITARSWSFGDGATSSAAAPTHEYASDGTYTARLAVTNSAGFVSGTDVSVVVDSVAPDTVITGAPSTSQPVRERDLTFTYRDQPATAGATFLCALDDATPAPCPADGRTFQDVQDGEHTFSVRARDEAGNEDPTPATVSFLVDGPPPAPTLTTLPLSPSTDPAPLLRGIAEPGATVAVFATGDCTGDVLHVVSAEDLAAGVPVTVTPDAESRFSALAVDPEGLESPCSEPLVYVEDSTAPDTVITGGPPAGATVATGTAAFTYAAVPAPDAAGYVCALDGAAATPCPATGLTLEGLADGPHGLTVAAVDRAGNTDPSPATRTWTVDVPDPGPAATPTPTASPQPEPTATPAPGTAPATSAASAPVPPAPAPAITGPPVAPDLGSPTVRPVPTVSRLTVRVDRRARTATLTFRVPAGARALCAVDGGRARACRSPLRLKRLQAGVHTVGVRVALGARRSATVTRRFRMPRRR